MTEHAPTRVVIVRHTEPEESMVGKCYGSLDVGLSDAGVRHATRLGVVLGALSIDGLYASPRRRALMTADAIGRLHGLGPTTTPELRELDFGALEGRTYDEIATAMPDIYAAWMEHPTTVQFPGGECFADLRGRVIAAGQRLRREHPGETIVIVTHGGVARTILADALQMPDEAIFRLDQRFGAINVIDWFEDTPVVRLLNGSAAATVGIR